MAIAVAQAVVNNTQFGSSAGSISVTLTVAAGSTLVVFFGVNSDGVSATFSCADNRNAGNYSDGAHVHATPGGIDFSTFRFYKTNVAAGATTVTVTGSVSELATMVWVLEITGSDGNAPLASGGQIVSAPGTGANAISSGTLSNASQPALVVGFALDGEETTTTPPAVGTGFTSAGSDTTTVSRVESKRVTTTGSNPATFTAGNGSDTFNVLAYIFAEASAGGPSGVVATAAMDERRRSARPSSPGGDAAPPLAPRGVGLSTTTPRRRRDTRPAPGSESVVAPVPPTAFAGASDAPRRAAPRAVSGSWDVSPPLVTTPTSGPPLGGLVFWNKGDAGVSLSGSNVTAYADQSSNGYNLVASTTAPTFVPNALNGLPGINYGSGTSSTAGLVNTSADLLPPGSARSVLAVVVPANTVANAVCTFHMSASAVQWMACLGLNSHPNIIWSDALVVDINTTTAALPSTAPLIAEWYGSSNPGGTLAHYQNGVQRSLVSSTMGNAETGPIGFALGYQPGISTRSFIGVICEILVYDHVLSAGDMAAARAYLNTRYFVAPPLGTFVDVSSPQMRAAARRLGLSTDAFPGFPAATLGPLAEVMAGARRPAARLPVGGFDPAAPSIAVSGGIAPFVTDSGRRRLARAPALTMAMPLPTLPPQTVIVARSPAPPTAAIGLTYTGAVGVTAPTRAQ